MNSKDVPQDSASVRNIATFIGELAEVVPHQVLANVSLLLVHLDSEARLCNFFLSIFVVASRVLYRFLLCFDLTEQYSRTPCATA